jgi:mRNA-degrading endonuclease RelE of RelBE toxin-antitoxin system
LTSKYVVNLTRQAEHFYRKSDKKIQTQLRESFLTLEEAPSSGKRLHGDLKENYSLRVGKKLRIIYTISENDKAVFVIAIGPRRNVYQ